MGNMLVKDEATKAVNDTSNQMCGLPAKKKTGLKKKALSINSDLEANEILHLLRHIKAKGSIRECSILFYSATMCEIPVHSFPSVASKVITEYHFL